MKKIGILGSTGSIGVQALDVIQKIENFEVTYLSANNNAQVLADQALNFNPDTVCLVNSTHVSQLKSLLSHTLIKVVSGRDALLELASRDDVDIMLNSLVGAPGMEPTINSVKAGVDVALSNKESMVMAGHYIMKLAKENDVSIFPVDSEHSAIWQCLVGEHHDEIKRLILTGSGGPFRTRSINEFSKITLKEALNHPNWDMGAKITIDSATMMNKGLEVIEARWLFDIPSDRIDIVVHPESIIHSMVEFNDGSVKAQLGLPDMKIPIQYALTYPHHSNLCWENLDLVKIGSLNFEAPNLKKFPCIRLAYEVLKANDSSSIILNVANDIVVEAFLQKQILFVDIPRYIGDAITSHDTISNPSLENIFELTDWTQSFLYQRINT